MEGLEYPSLADAMFDAIVVLGGVTGVGVGGKGEEVWGACNEEACWNTNRDFVCQRGVVLRCKSP